MFTLSPMDTLTPPEEAKICNGEKTVSLTSVSEKTVQPHVEE